MESQVMQYPHTIRLEQEKIKYIHTSMLQETVETFSIFAWGFCYAICNSTMSMACSNATPKAALNGCNLVDLIN